MNHPQPLAILGELADAKPVADSSIVNHFQAVPDFRREHGRRHLLIDVLVIAVCATIADCDSFVEMAEYGRDKEGWLRSFLLLPHGIPSHDTFRRVLLRLDPVPFRCACVRFATAAADRLRSLSQTMAISTPSTPAPPSPPQPLPASTHSLAQAPTPQPTPTLPQSQPAPQSATNPLATDVSSTPTSALVLAEQPAQQQQPATPQQSSVENTQPQQADAIAAVARTPRQTKILPEPTAVESESAQLAMTQSVALSEQKQEGQRRHLSVDGKTVRGSFDKGTGHSALHLVSVWANEDRLTLGQVAVDAKSNEITAIPEVLSLVDLAGTVVSIDAMGTQEAIVVQIREGRGDYVLAVKENQPRLFKDVLASFVRHFEQVGEGPDVNELVVVSKGEHGRKEKRTYTILEDVSGIRDLEKWRDVKRLIMVERECEKSDGTHEEETRYFIGSAACGVEAYAQWIRGHWGIENRLHWVLDVIFHEDESRVRKEHGTENLAMLRRLALGLLGNDQFCKRSIRGKRKKAARQNDYLVHILLGLPDLEPPVKAR